MFTERIADITAFHKMPKTYQELSPRTRDLADQIDKDDLEWNKVI